MVGVKGFEPPAPCSQSTYATKLRYTPLDPVAVTAVGFAPDDEIYLTIPASICQHLFSIFPKKLLSLSSSLRSAPWLPCVRGAVRRRAGLKGCPMGRGQGGGQSPSPICAPKPSFRRFRCSAWLIQLRQRTALSPLKRSCSRFAPRTLRFRTEPALRAAPVFRMAYFPYLTAFRMQVKQIQRLPLRGAGAKRLKGGPWGIGARGRGPQAPSPICTRIAAALNSCTI